jgi:hypothetical protein
MTNKTSCNVCAFYEDHIANRETIVENAGLCRFNPPVTQPEVSARGLWPVVGANDWCGHFSSESKAA